MQLAHCSQVLVRILQLPGYSSWLDRKAAHSSIRPILNLPAEWQKAVQKATAGICSRYWAAWQDPLLTTES